MFGKCTMIGGATVLLLACAGVLAAEQPPQGAGPSISIAISGAGPASQPTRSWEATEIAPRRSAPTRADEHNAASTAGNVLSVGRVVFALGIVLTLILAMRWLGRRVMGLPGPASAAGVVRVLSRTMIAPRQQVLLIRVGRRLLLVGNSGAQMSSLCEISDPEEVAGLVGQLQEHKSESLSTSFRSLFGRAHQAFGGTGPKRSEEPEPVTGQESPDEAAVATTREEIGGLLEKVRLMSGQFKRT